MIHYPYLIIGGGITCVAAVRGIRKADTESRIGVISSEPHPPYKRPFLSKALAEHGQRFAVIGGGFIGSKIAAALCMNGNRVTMIFPEEGIGARIFPKALSHFFNARNLRGRFD